MQQSLPHLLGVFEKVLGPPNDQLVDDTRSLLIQAVHFMYKANPSLFQNHAELLRLANA